MKLRPYSKGSVQTRMAKKQNASRLHEVRWGKNEGQVRVGVFDIRLHLLDELRVGRFAEDAGKESLLLLRVLHLQLVDSQYRQILHDRRPKVGLDVKPSKEHHLLILGKNGVVLGKSQLAV